MSRFTIDYTLADHGWADVRFANSLGQCESGVSYLHDSLGQLADMAIKLQHGAVSAKTVFMDEPGELQFAVEVRDDKAVYEIRRFRDWHSWGMRPENDYEVGLSGSCQPRRIVQQIFAVLRDIHDEIGPEEYKKRWLKHEFPSEKYRSLKEG